MKVSKRIFITFILSTSLLISCNITSPNSTLSTQINSRNLVFEVNNELQTKFSIKLLNVKPVLNDFQSSERLIVQNNSLGKFRQINNVIVEELEGSLKGKKWIFIGVYKENSIDITKTGFTGVTLDSDKKITDYGYFSTLAIIFDTDETQASASQFSPATTPTLNFRYEVSASEGNAVETDNLSYYLNQAGSGFSKGFVKLQNATSGAPIPGIVTQMMATEAGGKVITNWITPAAK